MHDHVDHRGAAGLSRRRHEGEVHVAQETGLHRRRADGLAGGSHEPGQRRLEHCAAIDPQPGLHGLPVPLNGVAYTEVGDPVTADAHRLARLEAHLGAVPVRLSARECNGEHDDPEVHDHPAVGPPEQPVDSLSPCREDELADSSRSGKGTEPERQQRREAAQTERYAGDDGQRASPCRPLEPVAQELAGRLAPRQRGSDRHQEQQAQRHRRRHAIEVGPADGDPLAVDGLEDEREDRTEQNNEGEPGE